MPSPINAGSASAGLSRRALVRYSSLGAVGLAGGVIATGKPTLADPPRYDADAMAARISSKLFADDGLALPAPDKPTVSELARGTDRTLVLGGGGESMSLGIAGSFTASMSRKSISTSRKW